MTQDRLRYLCQVGNMELKLQGEAPVQEHGAVKQENPVCHNNPKEFAHWIDSSLGALFDRCVICPMLASG